MTRRTSQRVVWALLAGAPTFAAAQDAAGAQLWRLAATTVPLPPALAAGSAAAFWNPAQYLHQGRARAGLEVVQAPSEVGASGFLAALHVVAWRAGHLGLLYGRMQIDGLVRTTTSPEPQAGAIPHDTHTLGITWTRLLAGTAVGATLAYHRNRLDQDASQRWTLDLGVQRRLGDVARLGAATHFLAPRGAAASRDVYGAAGLRLWHGELWPGSGAARVELRYGVTLARGFTPDHQAGLGFDLADAFGADLLVAREGGYGGVGWRPAGGIHITVGRYRLTVARDVGVNDIGSAFRVGLEARIDD